MSTLVESPSGRVRVFADGEEWRIYIDEVLLAEGVGEEAHAAALERLASTYDDAVRVELLAAARYWRGRA